MRIHRIQVQGIRAPRGERRFALDPAFNLLLCRDAAEARDLVRLVATLLHPDDELRGLTASGAGSPARADVALSVGRESYQLVADLERRRVLLGRYDRDAGRVVRVATEPARIRELLESGGVGELEVLQVCGVRAEPAGQAELRSSAGPPVDYGVLQRAQAAARAQVLGMARERLARIEAELKEVEVELERRAPLGDALEDLDARVPRVRLLETERDRERNALETSRRARLEERRRLRAVPDAQATGMWLGVALGAAGAAGGALVVPWLYAASLIGVGVAGAGLALTRVARSGLARVDRELAALRARGSALERRIEDEASPLHRLQRALELGSLEALEDEAAEYRMQLGRAEALRRDLAAARADFPEEAEQELRAIRARLDRPAEPEPPPTPEAAPAARASAGPEALVAAAARAARLDASDLRARVGPTLHVYLRALTDGAYPKAGHLEGEGWLFRRRDWKRGAAFEELPEGDRPRVALALQLALLETLAPAYRVPLLVGPDLEAEDATRRRAALRVLRRLGAAVQVIVFGDEAGWGGRPASPAP